MPYQSSYQSDTRSRRNDYENIGQDSSPSGNKMQTMEILSGGEYGSEFDESSNGGLGNRWFVYGCMSFLVLIVVLATHPVDTETSNNSNQRPTNNDDATATPEHKHETPGKSWEVTTQAVDEEEEENTAEFYFDMCDVPSTYQRGPEGFLYLNTTNFCLPEDKLAAPDQGCGCLNPTVPATPYWIEKWTNTTNQNIALVNKTLAAAQELQLDVVFLGDSITEHWNGRDSGVRREKDYNVSVVFNQLFHKATGGTVEGLALGVAGDRTQNLLYRIQNGEMPPGLNPKVWWINIGTNNLGSDNCNADAITVGNIRIVEEIRIQHPKAPIVLNSLLPRGREELLHINPMWPVMKAINKKLACYAGTHDNLYFFNATDLFIYSSNSQDYGLEYYVNQSLMNDYIHPSGEGSMVWGQKIVEQLGKIIKK